MLTAVLIAIFYAFWRSAGFPFVPFDVFDWLTRVLPGPVIGFGIHTMVSVIRALHLGPTSVVAKTAEQAMGVAGLFVTGIVGGAILFGILRALHGRYAYLLGLLLGLAVGIPVLLISAYQGRTASVAPALSAGSILADFVIWGLALAWVYRGLTPTIPAAHVDAATALVERVNRRQFLVRLGGASAVITVAGAVVGALSPGRRPSQGVPAGIQRWSTTHALPNADAAVIPAPGTRPEYTPLEQHYRIDINTIPPAVDEAQWTLKIGGLVEQPLSLTLWTSCGNTSPCTSSSLSRASPTRWAAT